ncbi:hypothetical protein CEP54_013559 [Fusarium duplospermum]|uniref:Sporulation-specific protein Sps2p n=1 Tax=Fusarium duplospermum TaxID=1325734 RepID=A0A428P255_9HYPO|nr:hypothetical protein CEP54_013559 [Fusarium duplospermum]
MAASNPTRTAVWLRFALLLSGLTTSARAGKYPELTHHPLTLTETTQVSSIAEACATYTGDLEIANLTDFVNLTGIEKIDGELRFDNSLADPDHVTLYSSTLQNITTGLLIYGPSEVDSTSGWLNVSLPVLRSAYSIGVYGPWSRVSLDTDPEMNVTGSFIVHGNNKMKTSDLYVNASVVWFIQVTEIDFSSGSFLTSSADRVGYVAVKGNEGLKQVLLNSLEWAKYAIRIFSNPDLDEISMPLLTNASYVQIQNNGRDAVVSLPELEFLGNRSHESSQISAMGTGAVFQDLIDISLPKLKQVHGDWRFFGKLNFTSNLFSELYLPRLETANCTLGIDDNIALNDLWLPRLDYVKDLEIHANPRLLNVTANLLKTADKINMTGPFTNVEFFSVETVTGDFFLVGDDTMDCSWFDEHFLNNIVKGSYKCVGNHTKPETERKPSTPTDEAQLEAWGSGKDSGSDSGGNTGDEDGSTSKSSSNGSGGGGLSTGAKAGIAVGVSVVGLALILGAWLLYRKKKAQKAPVEPSNADSGFQKAELDGSSKTTPVDIDKEESKMDVTETVQAGELPDSGKVELPAKSARVELPA